MDITDIIIIIDLVNVGHDVYRVIIQIRSVKVRDIDTKGAEKMDGWTAECVRCYLKNIK